MQFDSKSGTWVPAHDHGLRLGRSWPLALALAVTLLALGAAALLTGPQHAPGPRAPVAAAMP